MSFEVECDSLFNEKSRQAFNVFIVHKKNQRLQNQTDINEKMRHFGVSFFALKNLTDWKVVKWQVMIT